MGLSLDTSFSADLLASGSTDYIRQSGEESADTPFQLPDYSGQEDPETSAHPQAESSSCDVEPLTPADSDNLTIASDADAVTSEGTDPASTSGKVHTATSSLSALPDSMIWMQPQDFQALTQADLALVDANAELVTEEQPDLALLEPATDTEAGSDTGDGLLSHTTPTSTADSSGGLLSASAQASTLPLWMMAPILTPVSLSSASASITASDPATSLPTLSLADGADAVTVIASRETALATATSTASSPLPLAASLNSNLSGSSSSITLASVSPQTTATTLGDEATSTLLAAAASPVQLTAETAASQRQSANNPTTSLLDSGISTSLASSSLFGISPAVTTLSPSLAVESGSGSWGQQLVNSLGERVHLQASQQIQQATIRLDPPELGRLEVTVRQESDRLSVQISTSNSALRDALQETREQLRQILIPQYGAGVEVEINYSGDGRQQAQTEALLEEEIVSNGITLTTGQEVAETAGAAVNSGLLDTLV